jgi:formiminotetrahydrofolate cyclodeaminase
MIDRTFVDELASKAPTPGGGGASAYCGALAAALSSMVCNLTLGKQAYAVVEEEVAAALVELGKLQDRLLELVDADAQAFTPLAAAYAMPKETPEQQAEKEAALQQALITACEVPLEIMQASARVIDLGAILAEKGSRMAVSDAGASVLLAKAALKGALLTVLINCASMKDRNRAEAYLNQANTLLDTYTPRADRIYEMVVKELSA